MDTADLPALAYAKTQYTVRAKFGDDWETETFTRWIEYVPGDEDPHALAIVIAGQTRGASIRSLVVLKVGQSRPEGDEYIAIHSRRGEEARATLRQQ